MPGMVQEIPQPIPQPAPQPELKQDVTVVEDQQVQTAKGGAWWKRLGYRTLDEARAAGWFLG